MQKMLWAKVVIFLIIRLCLSQKAILMSSSLGYYNIRQVNNIVKIYQHLRNNGFNDEDIILIIAQVQACCEKNHLFSTLSFYDGDYTNIFRNIQIDYYQSQVTVQSVAELIMGYYIQGRTNRKRLRITKNEKLLIYITGHGGDTYFKIRQRQAIIDEQFSQIFEVLSKKDQLSKVGVISDSCSAITPFQKTTIPNFIAIASSSFGQKSLSHGYDSKLNQPKTDDFTFYFDQVLSQKAVVKGLSSLESWSFKDLHKYMDPTRLQVNSKLIANKLSKTQKLVNFFKINQKQIQYKRFQGNLNIQNFFKS